MGDSGDEGEDYYGLCDDNYNELVALMPKDDGFAEDLKCRTMKTNDVEHLLNEDIKSLSSELKISWWLVSLFLRQYKWNLKEVKDAYFNNAMSLLTNSNLIPLSGPVYNSDSAEFSDFIKSVSQSAQHNCNSYINLEDRDLKQDVCSICFSSPSSLVGVSVNHDPSLTSLRLLGMSCGHVFCLECWRAYFDYRISSSQASIVECMAANCSVRIPDDFILSVIDNPESVEKHRRHILNESIEAHPRLRNCNDTHCDRVIYALEEAKPLRVTCYSCNSQFCFSCSVEFHAPAQCETIKAWLQKCRDDSSTATYMAAHTKDCPQCGVVIEKNGGCNHMRCAKCGHEFCWVCLGPWKNHPVEYYDCSKYRRAEVSEIETNRTRAREYLQRYLFYYGRWENHERSLRLEERHYKEIQNLIQSKLQAHEGTWIDWQHLLSAWETLRKCRYTLKYTYPYAYFRLSEEDPASHTFALFEYQQGLLEAEVEALSWSVAKAEITNTAGLMHQMNICEKHRRTLIQEFYSNI